MSKDFFAEYLTKISFLLNNRDNTLVVEKGKKHTETFLIFKELKLNSFISFLMFFLPLNLFYF